MDLPIKSITVLPVQPVTMEGLKDICEVLQAKGIGVVQKMPVLRPAGAYDAQRRQFRAEALLERAKHCAERPVLAVTDADCYGGDLNFVFGMADVGGRVAVVSLHRLRSATTRQRFRQRVAKEIIHELGHGEGLRHCCDPKCVMHFSNSLSETDAKGSDLCWECLRRLKGREPDRC
jgi:archaemetzincin